MRIVCPGSGPRGGVRRSRLIVYALASQRRSTNVVVLTALNTYMSDIARQGSPRIVPSTSMASSPSRPSPLSRPHWPYASYSHAHRPSSSSSSVSGSSATAQAWEYRGSGAWTPSTPSSGLVRRPSALGLSTGVATGQEDSTRHWSYTVSNNITN